MKGTARRLRGEDLRVEDERRYRLQRVEQLGVAPRDAVEGARVHLDALAGLVDLRANAVDLSSTTYGG